MCTDYTLLKTSDVSGGYCKRALACDTCCFLPSFSPLFIYNLADMPLANSQYHINEMLLALTAAERPASGVMPVHIPMAAAAACVGGGTGSLPGLAVRAGSAAPLRSAASASWPDLRRAAAAAAAVDSDQSDADDDTCHDDTRGFKHHPRLATIVSGDAEAQMQATADAAMHRTESMPAFHQQQEMLGASSSSSSAEAAPLAGLSAASLPAAAAHHVSHPDHNSHPADVQESLDTLVNRAMHSSSGGSSGGGSSSSRAGTAGGGAAADVHTAHYPEQQDTAGHRDIVGLQRAAATAAVGRYNPSRNEDVSGLKRSTAGGDGDVVMHQRPADSHTIADMV